MPTIAIPERYISLPDRGDCPENWEEVCLEGNDCEYCSKIEDLKERRRRGRIHRRL